MEAMLGALEMTFFPEVGNIRHFCLYLTDYIGNKGTKPERLFVHMLLLSGRTNVYTKLYKAE